MITATSPTSRDTLWLDKELVRRLVAEQNVKMGFVPDPEATAEKAQAMTEALGFRPEDNAGSCGIIKAREE